MAVYLNTKELCIGKYLCVLFFHWSRPVFIEFIYFFINTDINILSPIGLILLVLCLMTFHLH